MSLFRSGMIAVAQNRLVSRVVTQNGVSKGFALRFIAGETLDDAMSVASDLNHRGLKVTLDKLGENVRRETAAEDAAASYIAMLDRIAAAGVESTISIKLTMLGLDLSDELCRQHTVAVLDRARTHGIFVRIDMEGSPYTQRTLDLAYALLPDYPQTVGIVLQSYLYRTDRDVREAVARGIRVRLVKGAYAEPPTIAYQSKADVDAAYRRQVERLLEGGNYPAIATHDPEIVEFTERHAAHEGIDRSRFEFQLLYGIRRDLQERLVQEGYNVRVYVPFGSQWYPYFVRRMAERPANLLFVARNVLRP
ncbi:MAG TPA: proline dehydrogenase family protein [Thermomicrobiaceae bacterium]|nr:proline dehydrogenase family protein [Thermomicrobiaceae bacterium]